MTPEFPAFDRQVPTDGYCWWYVDALSDDGKWGLALIAFVGSVFSPHYARAQRRGRGDPENHCALNAVLYGRRKRWALTERGRAQTVRTATHLAIGPSSLRWWGDNLVVDVDEVTVPIPSRLRGRIVVHPGGLTGLSFVLDKHGRHRWWPVAPCAHVEVRLERPAVAWSGPAYLDINAGDEPLENAFASWNWSRAHLSGDRTAILYDVKHRDGARQDIALEVGKDGEARRFDPPPVTTLPPTPIWRMPRETRAGIRGRASVTRTLEDTPFYSRSVLDGRLLDEPVAMVHESLSMQGFQRRWVQALLPFRAPRRAS